uniref:SGNH hydrolase-type esterase domain-containing protein n=1 Tax=Alexandrium monilatum TaxID=311494 RepID=A0A6T0WS70_9DINO
MQCASPDVPLSTPTLTGKAAACQRSVSPIRTVPSPCQQKSMALQFRNTCGGCSELNKGGPPRQQSVLLFGDSLTLGTVCNAACHPYGKRLAELMGGAPGMVSVSGRAGELAMDMGKRLQSELAQRKASPPSHVVILAGTNDVRSGVPPEALLQQLRALHGMIRAAGAKCVAVTVPQCGKWDMTTVPLAPQRKFVNEGLRAAAVAGTQGRGPPLRLADFDALLARMPTAERTALFSDSCHFTPSGYDLLADLVHAAVQSSAPRATPLPGPVAEGRLAGQRVVVPESPVAKPVERHSAREIRPAMPCAVPRSDSHLIMVVPESPAGSFRERPAAVLPRRMCASRSMTALSLAGNFARAQPYVRQYVTCQ